jgi:hypothetical protein
MLKVIATVNNRRTLFLGLSRENTRRLHKGQPIPVDAQALTQGALLDGPIQDVVLFAGETEDACAEELGQWLPEVREAHRGYREAGPRH